MYVNGDFLRLLRKAIFTFLSKNLLKPTEDARFLS